MNNSAATPTQPFRVLTQDGRSLIMDAIDSVSLLNEIGIKYGSVSIRPLTKIEREQFNYKPLDGYEQLELNAEYEAKEAIAS